MSYRQSRTPGALRKGGQHTSSRKGGYFLHRSQEWTLTPKGGVSSAPLKSSGPRPGASLAQEGLSHRDSDLEAPRLLLQQRPRAIPQEMGTQKSCDCDDVGGEFKGVVTERNLPMGRSTEEAQSGPIPVPAGSLQRVPGNGCTTQGVPGNGCATGLRTPTTVVEM